MPEPLSLSLWVQNSVPQPKETGRAKRSLCSRSGMSHVTAQWCTASSLPITPIGLLPALTCSLFSETLTRLQLMVPSNTQIIFSSSAQLVPFIIQLTIGARNQTQHFTHAWHVLYHCAASPTLMPFNEVLSLLPLHTHTYFFRGLYKYERNNNNRTYLLLPDLKINI